MKHKIDSTEVIKDLAMEGLSADDILKTLEARDMVAHPGRSEIESIVAEVRTGMNLVPQRSSRLLARIIGVIALVMGIGGMMIGTMDQFHVHRYSPGGYGLLAAILGAVLIIKPGWSNSDPS